MPEHTIAENLTRLQNAKTAIGNAITAKGGTVSQGDGLEEFATDIGTITNQYTQADEGKVVNNGALVSQTAYPTTITENGTYNTTENNSVTVDVAAPITSSILTHVGTLDNIDFWDCQIVNLSQYTYVIFFVKMKNYATIIRGEYANDFIPLHSVIDTTLPNSAVKMYGVVDQKVNSATIDTSTRRVEIRLNDATPNTYQLGIVRFAT